MLIKLAFKNVMTSIKDFGVYFLTISIGISVFYMFNSIESQTAILDVTSRQIESMQVLTKLISVISIFISFILGFLVLYANGFLIKRRTKELGIYLTLGMKKSEVNFIFVIETFIAAFVALITGIILGIGLSQIMSLFTAKLFAVNLTEYRMIFSMNALTHVSINFGVIYILVMIFNLYYIYKSKLIDLIYFEKKNSEILVKNNKIMVALFILSLLILGTAYSIVLIRGISRFDSYFYASILLGIVGTFIFYYSFSNMFFTFINRKKSLYYKGINMFVVRQLSSNFNRNFISISIVNLSLFLTISILGIGLSLSNIISDSVKSTAPVDASVYLDYHQVDHYINYLSEYYDMNLIKDYDDLSFYGSDILVSDFIELGSLENDSYEYTAQLVSLSDYNRFRELQGLEAVSLNEEVILVSNMDDISHEVQRIVDEHQSFSYQGETLTIADLDVTNLQLNTIKTSVFTLIIEDRFINFDDYFSTNLNFVFKSEEAEVEFYETNESLIYETANPSYYFQTKTSIYEEGITLKIIVSYIAIYIGFVMVITAASVLAIQQISESNNNKKRFKLLKKLGVESNMIRKGLFYQILVYFVAPLILAMIHSIVGLKVGLDLVELLGQTNLSQAVIQPVLIILIIFVFYFIVTYINGLKIIEEK